MLLYVTKQQFPFLDSKLVRILLEEEENKGQLTLEQHGVGDQASIPWAVENRLTPTELKFSLGIIRGWAPGPPQVPEFADAKSPV